MKFDVGLREHARPEHHRNTLTNLEAFNEWFEAPLTSVGWNYFPADRPRATLRLIDSFLLYIIEGVYTPSQAVFSMEKFGLKPYKPHFAKIVSVRDLALAHLGSVVDVHSYLDVERVKEPSPAPIPSELDDAVTAFAQGLRGEVRPSPDVVEMAYRIVRAAVTTEQPEITLDVDGALAFDLRAPGGGRLMAELTPEGELDGGVYVRDGERVRRMMALETEQQVISAILEDPDARS